MESLTFVSSAQFRAWLGVVVQSVSRHYDRVPVGKQTWIYGDGHMEETQYGSRGGTLLSNLKFLTRTTTGQLEHSKELLLAEDIDTRGGVVLTVTWSE